MTYDYVCEINSEHKYSESRSMNEDQKRTTCAEDGCEGKLIRIYTPPPIQFKGTGYNTSKPWRQKDKQMPDNLIPDDYPDFAEYGTPPCAESYPDAFFPEEAEDYWLDDLNNSSRKTLPSIDMKKKQKRFALSAHTK